VVSSTPRPHFTPGKDPVRILQEAGWAPGPVWTGGKSRPRVDSIADRPARSQSLYRLSYRVHHLVRCTERKASSPLPNYLALLGPNISFSTLFLNKDAYTGCNRRNVRDFGRVFLMVNYTDITQNSYIQS
jgi:hypothetical protein